MNTLRKHLPAPLPAALLLAALTATGCAYLSETSPKSLVLYLSEATFWRAVNNQTSLCTGRPGGTADACGGQQVPPAVVPPIQVNDPRVRWIVCGVGDGATPVQNFKCISILDGPTR